MKILILAAGFGTRLKEYGEHIPKGLIPTATGTLMDHLVAESESLNAPIALVTNERFFQKYTEWCTKSGKNAVRLINDGAQQPENRLGAIGDIVFSLNTLQWWNDDLLVIPSDTFFDFSLRQFVDYAQQMKMFTLVVRDLGDKSLIANRLGCATVQDGRVVSFVEKPTVPATSLAAIPFYYYPQDVLRLLLQYQQAGENMDAPSFVIPWFLSRQVPVAAYTISGKTLDVGTVEDVAVLHSL